MVTPSAQRQFYRNFLWATALAFVIAATAVVATVYAVKSRHRGPEARGATVYGEHCARCHGAGLQGQPNWRHVDARGRLPAPPLNASGHAWMHGDDDLAHIIKFSVLDIAGPGYQTDMPSFDGKLTDADIAALVAFIRSTWPSGMQAAQALLNPGHAGMPAHPDPDWRLPADCEEPVRGGQPKS